MIRQLSATSCKVVINTIFLMNVHFLITAKILLLILKISYCLLNLRIHFKPPMILETSNKLVFEMAF